MGLKYLFKATFTDGSEFIQDPQDKSYIEENRSSFFDFLKLCEGGVIHYLPGIDGQQMTANIAPKKIHTFELFENKSIGSLLPKRKKYLVDLIDGHFEIAGQHIIATPEQNLTKYPQEYRLIFFRERQQDTTVSATMVENKDGLIPHFHNYQDAGPERITYFIGWQCTIAGKNYQQLIGIK